MKTVSALLLILVVPVLLSAQELTPMEQLGKMLFFDDNLSTPHGQSCATCHAPEVGFTGPVSDINAHGAAYPGVIEQRTGNRKPPTAAYGGESPVLYYDPDEEVWIGGMFWDGRATGWTLGDPLAEQAQGPFLNPLEQNNPNAKLVCRKVAQAEYADLFEDVWGPGSLDPVKDVPGTYERIARAISAYEQSAEVNPFTSKYDYYLAGEATLTGQETWGLELFEGKAMCSACHISEPGPAGEPPLFTDFTYDNLGIPKNPELPFYDMPRKWNPDGKDWADPGLGGFLKGAGYDKDSYMAEWGKHKVPTLRNVDMRPYPEFVKAFGHNGYFKSLEEIVHFYNMRDVAEENWPAPEIAMNVNVDELGDLGLSSGEEAALVAFMKTLTDGYPVPPAPMAAHKSNRPPSLRMTGPNPFNPSTSFSYMLQNDAMVSINVYDVMGRSVSTLVNEYKEAGEHVYNWNASDLPSGTYFIRMAALDQVSTQKVLLLK